MYILIIGKSIRRDAFSGVVCELYTIGCKVFFSLQVVRSVWVVRWYVVLSTLFTQTVRCFFACIICLLEDISDMSTCIIQTAVSGLTYCNGYVRDYSK